MQLDITLDSGATVSYLRLNKAIDLNLEILPNDQLALLADRKTRIASIGEVDFIVTISDIQMRLRALVMKDLQADCFGGTTFHVDNGVEAKIKEGTIIIHGKYTVYQSNPYVRMPLFPPPSEKTVCHSRIESCTRYSSDIGDESRIQNDANLTNVAVSTGTSRAAMKANSGHYSAISLAA